MEMHIKELLWGSGIGKCMFQQQLCMGNQRWEMYIKEFVMHGEPEIGKCTLKNL